MISAAVQKGCHRFEWIHRRSDGEDFPAEVLLTLISFRGKQIIHSVCRDITRRKADEQALKASEKKFRVLFESAGDAIMLLNDEKIEDCNQKTLELFQTARELIIGKGPDEFSPTLQPDGENSVKKAHEKMEAAISGKPQLFEWLHTKTDGTCFNAEVSLNSMELNNRSYVQAIIRDITLRKKTEEELERYRGHLEEMVKKRTAELTAANEKLKAEIAERMRIEEELRKTGDYLENVFQSSADAISITDRLGKFIKTNKRGTELFGREWNEMKGMSAYEFYADKDRYRKIAETLRKEGFVRRCEVVMRKKDGAEFPAETSVSLLKDGNGKIMGTMGVTRDMSDLKKALIDLETINRKLNLEIEERKRIEAELTQANSYLENVLENSADPVGIADKKGKIIRWNRMAEELFGYTFTEMKGKSAFDAYSDKDELNRMLDKVKARGFVTRHEISMKKKDGTVFPVEISVALLKNENQEIIGSVSVGRDLSEIRKAYAEIEKANRQLNREIGERRRIEAELRQTNVYLENVLENSADGIGLADMHGRMVSWNRAGEELYGYTSEEIRGTSFADRYSDKNQLEKMLSELRKNGFVKHYEILMRKNDRTDYPFEVSIAILRDSDGKNIGSICVARDLSDVKKSLTETRMAREAAEKANSKITDSLNYAKLIQGSLLANLDVVKSYIPDSFFIWEPKDIVGGDIFFADSFEDGFIIAVIDCTGHGVPGAFMTMIAISAMNRIVKDEGCHDPAEILRCLNLIVRTTLQQDTDYALSDDGMDAGIVRVTHMNIESPALSFQASELSFAGAKIPLYYVRNGEINVIKGDRRSIGYRRSYPDLSFTRHTVSIEKGVSFYMTTDGVADQFGG